MSEYFFLDGPKGDQMRRKYHNEIKREMAEEEEAEALEEFKIECYLCGERWMPTDMHPYQDDQGHTQLICPYC